MKYLFVCEEKHEFISLVKIYFSEMIFTLKKFDFFLKIYIEIGSQEKTKSEVSGFFFKKKTWFMELFSGSVLQATRLIENRSHNQVQRYKSFWILNFYFNEMTFEGNSFRKFPHF